MTNALAAAKPADKPEDDDTDLRQEPITIDPTMVAIDLEGLAQRHIVIRLPLGTVADDLNSNRELWKRVQARHPKSLRKFDRLTIISYDESWCAEALVGEASFTGVTLTGLKIHRLPERNERLMNDGTYKIAWAGHGYTIHRCNDNFVVSGPHPNIQIAEKRLADLYPQVANY